MKRILFLLLVVVVLCLPGCSVLDESVPDALVSSEAITDQASAEAALNGLYNSLQSEYYYGGQFVIATEAASDNGVAAGYQQANIELSNNQIPTSNTQIESIYIAIYSTINSANSIISAVPGISMGTEDANRILGSAYFVRALAYFDLLRSFGEFYDVNSPYGMPLVTNPSLARVETPRATVAETYALIKSDLDLAAELLPANGGKQYASQGAANALLARYYLYRKEYAEALKLANELIGAGQYTLQSNYLSIFSEELGQESIFELSFTSQNPNFLNSLLTSAEVLVTPSLYEAFTVDDVRGTLYRVDKEFADRYRTYKYPNAGARDNNVPILRLAELYFIRSEASANLGDIPGALDDLNIIRSRAGVKDLYKEDDVPNLGAFYVMWLQEERLEFAYEVKRRFDLMRTDGFETILNLEAWRRIFPIPQREFRISDAMIQNPGYN